MKTLNIVSCFHVNIHKYIILGICCVIVFCNESYVPLATTSMKQNNNVEKVDTSTINVNANNFRRQEGYGNERPRGPPLPPSLAKRMQNKGKKYESQYLPFYPAGDWVYYRNASTNFPRPNIILNDTEPAYRDCNQICIKAYLNYGLICAKRLNRHDWVYEYKEFDDICQMELENCGSVGKRYDWYPLRQGPCATTDFPIQPSDGDAALKRLEEWEKRFLENTANDQVNPFIITTTTMPTAKPKKTPKER